MSSFPVYLSFLIGGQGTGNGGQRNLTESGCVLRGLALLLFTLCNGCGGSMGDSPQMKDETKARAGK